MGLARNLGLLMSSKDVRTHRVRNMREKGSVFFSLGGHGHSEQLAGRVKLDDEPSLRLRLRAAGIDLHYSSGRLLHQGAIWPDFCVGLVENPWKLLFSG